MIAVAGTNETPKCACALEQTSLSQFPVGEYVARNDPSPRERGPGPLDAAVHAARRCRDAPRGPARARDADESSARSQAFFNLMAGTVGFSMAAGLLLVPAVMGFVAPEPLDLDPHDA